MKEYGGTEKFFLFLITIISVLLLILATHSIALFGPQVVNVTRKSFSVLWTTRGHYTSCDIELFYDSDFSYPVPLTSEQKIIETEMMNPGEDGKQYGIAKIKVTGLSPGIEYYFKIYLDGNLFYSSSEPVSTMTLYDSADNDILHKAVYKSDGATPAFGAIVVAEIIDHFDKDIVLSKYPISGWVGDEMPGNNKSFDYDPNDISYSQYARINMNRFFDIDGNPISINGDDPDTPDINEGERIRFTIVHGTQKVFGQEFGQDHFIHYTRIESTGINNKKVLSAKISSSYKLIRGINPVTIPLEPARLYSGIEIYKSIENAGGIVNIIYLFKYGEWIPIVKISPLFYFNGDIQIGMGDAFFVFMVTPMAEGETLNFYGSPNLYTIHFKNGVNIFGIPQCPVGYNSMDMWLEIEQLSEVDKIEIAYIYINGWKAIIKLPNGYFPFVENISSDRICAVILKLKPGVLALEWCPINQ